MSSSSRCAACRYLRRRCSEDCILAPYFPASNPERFACVHRIFGASNVSRMLQQLPVELRGVAANNIVIEASNRIRDPVYGSAGMITHLQQQIYAAQYELAETQAQLAMLHAQLHHQQQFRPNPPGNQPGSYQPGNQFGGPHRPPHFF